MDGSKPGRRLKAVYFRWLMFLFLLVYLYTVFMLHAWAGANIVCIIAVTAAYCHKRTGGKWF